MLDLTLAPEAPVAVATIYDRVPGLAPGLRTALAPFNDVIMREAAQRALSVLDLRLACAEARDYAASSPIEPSSQGGRKIAALIAELVFLEDAAAPRTIIYSAAQADREYFLVVIFFGKMTFFAGRPCCRQYWTGHASIDRTYRRHRPQKGTRRALP